MIQVTGKGDFKDTRNFLTRMLRGDHYADLDRYGRMGLEALARATPIDTGLTARSWEYRVFKGKHPGVVWYNTNRVMGDTTPVAVLIQYGHGTGTGGYVQGRDFINPAIRPIFDQIAADVWKKVST